ncbi:MAG TPA: hypothetical protein PKD91_07640 [Bacteroidia bacterium]|nr:hypothetical protein [Bacteroidia bacterium]
MMQIETKIQADNNISGKLFYFYTMRLKTGLFIICFWLALPALVSGQAQRKGSMQKPFILSQQFKHSLGAGATFYKFEDGYEPIFQLAYNPSLSLTRSQGDFSFSVGSQLSGGYHFASSVDDSDFVYADFPLLLELNFGHNASKDFYSDLGWFFGGGYTYHLLKEQWNHGPVATIGVRGFFFGPSFTIRYSRYFASQQNDASLHTVTLLLNVGRYFEQVKLNNKVSRFSNGFRR